MPSKREIEQERNALRSRLEALYDTTQDLGDEIANALGWPDVEEQSPDSDDDEDLDSDSEIDDE
jgi:hypothetical protein